MLRSTLARLQAGNARSFLLTGIVRSRCLSQQHFITRASKYDPESTAIVSDGKRWSYGSLLSYSHGLATHLLSQRDTSDLNGERVAFLCPPSFDYTVMQWAIWRAGGVCVPLCVQHPASELEYVIENADCSIVLAHPDMHDRAQEACSSSRKLIPISVSKLLDTEGGSLPTVEDERNAMIIYTSGTTGKPKGVVSTHSTIEAQTSDLISSWEWSAKDVIYNVLPLHHVHGVINVVTCALATGATCELPPRFNAADTFQRFLDGGLTLFMAVPTVYVKLIDHYDAQPIEKQQALHESLGQLRLMVCGSAALPAPVMDRWQEVSGHLLLERYGMTEIGMALSNPYKGTRRPGSVGLPLPSVSLKLVSQDGQTLYHEHGERQPKASLSISGDLRVKGANVFEEYWRNPEATAKEFDEEGYFMTGDVVEYTPETNTYSILGRSSVDILKVKGFKISALDIEREILAHKDVVEISIVGVPDPRDGEKICAVAVVRNGLTLESIQDYLQPKLAPYKFPTVLKVVEEIPKNAMGKVNKKQLVKELFPDN